MKKCTKCGLEKSLDEFYRNKNYKGGIMPKCKPCSRDIVAERKRNQARTPGFIKKHNRLSRFKIKLKVFNHYGMSCARCGNYDFRVLCIDHVNGNGGKHRKELKATSIYPWLIRNGFPEGFQTLCANCNRLKQFENNEFPGQDSQCDETNRLYMEASEPPKQTYVIEPWSCC